MKLTGATGPESAGLSYSTVSRGKADSLLSLLASVYVQILRPIVQQEQHAQQEQCIRRKNGDIKQLERKIVQIKYTELDTV